VFRISYMISLPVLWCILFIWW